MPKVRQYKVPGASFNNQMTDRLPTPKTAHLAPIGPSHPGRWTATCYKCNHPDGGTRDEAIVLHKEHYEKEHSK